MTAIVFGSSFLHYAVHKIVGSELARILDSTNFPAQEILTLRARAQNVAGRNLRQTEPLLQQARLRAFAGTRRAHQNDDL